MSSHSSLKLGKHNYLPHVLAAAICIASILSRWPWKWLLSGAPLLTFALLVGSTQQVRVLAFAPLWIVILLVNLSCLVASSSWFLIWIYGAACYPALFLTCLFQFSSVATLVRRALRWVLRGLQFTNDTIAFFDLPALEIDVDVEGLMCVRGISFSLSSLTLVAHGIEVGIKLSDDLEVALVVDKVVVKLFRRIDITDVYGNIKGGLYEMTFGKLAEKTKDTQGNSLMVTDTSLLAAAAVHGDLRRPGTLRKQTMTEKMTGGKEVVNISLRSGLESVQQLPTDDVEARKRFHQLLDWINDTSAIGTSRKEVEAVLPNATGMDLRAAMCSQLHDKPTIPHPATRSVRVSTVQNLSNPMIRTYLHRLPLLLRCLLNPIAYLHPVFIESLTVGGSGRFLRHLLDSHLISSDAGVKNLKQRISSWLSDANFVFHIADVKGTASVPVDADYDIINHLACDAIVAYRTRLEQVDLLQIVQLGGADARVSVPSFLLPHHEHLLPEFPDCDEFSAPQDEAEATDSHPRKVNLEHETKKMIKDEATVQVSAHVRLPAVLEQSLLDFVAALVKATKIIEMEKDDPVEREGVVALAKGFGHDLKDSMRRVAVDAAANDRWIAKLVGRITNSLETMRGDVGYSGGIPVPLAPYRQKGEQLSKLLP